VKGIGSWIKNRNGGAQALSGHFMNRSLRRRRIELPSSYLSMKIIDALIISFIIIGASCIMM